VEGRSKPVNEDRVSMTMVVDDVATTTKHGDATANEAVFIAAQKALRKAHAEDVTHLTIMSPNSLLKGHMQDGWKRRHEGLHPFQDAIDELVSDFDQVVWA
jgi:ribonuclease HI